AELRAAMRSAGTVIWLDAPIEALVTRLRGMDDRPLLEGDVRARLQTLAGERADLYADAGIRIDASAHPEMVVADVLVTRGHLERLDPTRVQTPGQPCRAYVGSNVLLRVGSLLRAHGLRASLRVIADERVASLHGEAVHEALAEFQSTWYEVPAGEEFKSL